MDAAVGVVTEPVAAAETKVVFDLAGSLDGKRLHEVGTGDGTYANTLAIRGITEALEGRSHIVTTVIEHPATAHPYAWLEKHERSVTRIGVDADTICDAPQRV